jgi:hypothetical protein
LPPGLELAVEFPDAAIYSVAQSVPPIATVAAAGFFGYEHEGDDRWQWMSPQGQWTVRNSTRDPQTTTLSVDLVAIGMPRRITMSLDGAPVESILVDVVRKAHVLGPWTLTPGDHILAFAAEGDPVRPSDVAGDTRDRRPLTIAFRDTRWNRVENR